MDIDKLRMRPWILLSGTLCTHEIFDGFLDVIGLETSYRRPIEIKHPHIDDYIAEFDRVMCPGAVVCGFSLGAMVAAHLADRLDASAMILFGLNPFSDDPTKASSRRNLAQKVRAQGGSTALRSRLPTIHGPSAVSTKELIFSMADDTAHLISVQTELALNRPGAMRVLAATSYPIRFLTGSEDTTSPFKYAQAAAEAAVNGRALCLNGLGHYALAENPKECHETLKNGVYKKRRV